MSDQQLDRIVEDLANMAIDLGLNIEQIKECLYKAAAEEDGKPYAVDDFQEGQKENVPDDESKERDPVDLSDVTLQKRDVSDVGDLLDFTNYNTDINNNNNNNNNNKTYDPKDPYSIFNTFGKTAFGRKILSKATESVRQIAKKKGIYIVGRKGNQFLGIPFTPKGNYSKNKKGRPNGKMYTLDGLRKMKKKRVSFKKLPQLIDMMDTDAVLKKHKDFKFGFELKKQPRGCSGFGYTFPVGAGYGKSSARLFGKL